jgi:hypothetical protein
MGGGPGDTGTERGRKRQIYPIGNCGNCGGARGNCRSGALRYVLGVKILAKGINTKQWEYMYCKYGILH